MSLNPKKMSPAEIRRDKKGAGGERSPAQGEKHMSAEKGKTAPTFLISSSNSFAPNKKGSLLYLRGLADLEERLYSY